MTEPTKEAIEAASDFIPAKMGHTLRIALAVAFDAFAAQRVAEAIERCAQVAQDAEIKNMDRNIFTGALPKDLLVHNRLCCRIRDTIRALAEQSR